RVSQVFAPLLATVEDEATAARLREIAVESNRSLFADRSMSVEAQILEVIREMCDAEETLYLKDVASRFSDRHLGEYRVPITSRWIGRILRNSLHLVPAKSRGNFLIRADEFPKLRDLFVRYRVSGGEE